MKALGIKQFDQMSFKYLDITDQQWASFLGDVPRNVRMIIYADSGNGKTELAMRLAKLFTQFGKVAWLSYEQRHGGDLQKATLRNNMKDHSGKFIVIDPLAKIPKGVTPFEDLCNYIKKRGSPDFFFIDSIDYADFTKDQYNYLRDVVAPKKGLVFIGHLDGKLPAHKTGKWIRYDGHMGVFIKDFIAFATKNRMGGRGEYLIWEEEARLRNPLYFEKRAGMNPPKEKTKRPKKQSPQKAKKDG